jgi:rod shape determining protein RodA
MIIFISADLGSAVVYVFVLIVMLFIGGVKLRWFTLSAGAVAAISPLLWFNLMNGKQRDRIIAPFVPELLDPERLDEIMWQARQSVKAIAAGGFRGQGLGNGYMTQRHLIPAQHTDFIFSAVGEELGFAGCILVVLLLVIIICKCIYTGIKSNNPLGLLVCTGIAAMLIMQTLENIGMCLGILPVIGITLPFLSYGGSSVVTCFAAMGIVSGIKMRPKPVRFRTM